MTALTQHATPLGVFDLVASDAGLTHALPLDDPEALLDGREGSRAALRHLDAARRGLDAYFAGASDAFEGLPLAPIGTPFEREVWQALRSIPFGSTLAYGALAARLGRPGAARAVGRANAANPLWVIVPCHRVVGADGALVGYAGGLARKAWLLRHEGLATARALAAAVESEGPVEGSPVPA